MRYTKPFTPQQRLEAAAKYRSYRDNYKKLKATHPPRSRREQLVLRDYREAVTAFGEETVQPIRQINIDLLMELETKAMAAMYQYCVLRSQPRKTP